jgi:hypothetical protein
MKVGATKIPNRAEEIGSPERILLTASFLGFDVCGVNRLLASQCAVVRTGEAAASINQPF